jgi:glycosyltransferase 2 family protein
MSNAKEGKGKTRLQLILRIVVSTGLMAWLITMIDWEKAFRVMREGSPSFFVAAFLAIQITVLTSIWKWKMLIESPGKKNHPHFKASTLQLSKLYYIGLFFNNFMPGSVGGDMVRIYYLGKTTSVAFATTSVLWERLTSGGALVGIVLLSALFMDQSRPYLITLLILIGIVLIVSFILKFWMKKEQSSFKLPKGCKLHVLSVKMKQMLFNIAKTARDYKKESWLWWGVIILLSLLFQVGMAWINDLLFLSFGMDVPFLHLLVIITLISVITMIPVSLNGLGVREAGYVFFFQSIGVPDGIALSVSLLFFFLVTISSLIGGIFWLMERKVTEHEIIGQ